MKNYKKDELSDLEHKILVEMNLNFCNIMLNDLLEKKKIKKKKEKN